MSTLVKDPKSKNIHLDIPTPDGPVRLSSRTSNKEAAKMIAAKLQMFAKENKGKKVTKVKTLHLAAMLAKVVNTECTELIPLDEVLLPLAELSATSKSDRDIKRLVVTRFVEYMEQKGLEKLDQWDVETGHVGGFLKADQEAHKLSPRSVRNYGQALGAVFEVAYLHGLAQSNVVRDVKLPKRPKRSPRRPFTDPELVQTYYTGDTEWKEMLVCGSATGMRIGDVSLSVVGDLDFFTGFFRPLARKVNQFEPKPLPEWLLADWRKKFEGLPANTPLFPRAYKWMWINGNVRSTRVAVEFMQLLIRAGVREAGIPVWGVERVGANKYLPLTFGCLRHTYTTLLKISCQSEATRLDLAQECLREFPTLKFTMKLNGMDLLRVARNANKGVWINPLNVACNVQFPAEAMDRIIEGATKRPPPH